MHLKDEPLANALLKRAVDASVNDPQFVATMAELLLEEDHPAQARVVADHARAIGLADIQVTGLPPVANP